MTPKTPASMLSLPPRPLPAKEALAAILQRRGLTLEDLRGRSRKPWNIRARAIVSREMREAGYTLEAIGKEMGRHHTTVIYWLSLPLED